MAEAHLNFNEDSLNKESALYKLYIQFYEGMKSASQVDPPDYATNPPTTPDGEIDNVAISTGLAEYSTILMKNSAYMFASTISGVYPEGPGEGGGGEIGNYLLKTGDNMLGPLGAMQGFQAGYDGTAYLIITQDSEKKPLVEFYSNLHLSEKLTIDKEIYVNDSIYFSSFKTLYYQGDAFNIKSSFINIMGEVTHDNKINVGQITIELDNIYNNDNPYYHAGNSNIETVDWRSRNMIVHNDLTVNNNTSILGKISANNSFELGAANKKLIYSVENEEKAYIELSSDLSLRPGYGIEFNNQPILFVRQGADGVVSLSAPGMVLNLGDTSEGVYTKYIALQSDIQHYSGEYTIISKEGDGYFPNSFKAGCGNSSYIVISTYYNTGVDYGVRFGNRAKFGDMDGANVYYNINQLSLIFDVLHWRQDNGVQRKERIDWFFKSKETTSLFKDLSKEWSATVHFDSFNAEFFAFDKPLEVTSLSIVSDNYKTCLQENTLFFNDGCFLEGVTDGIRHSGNSYFDGDLSSKRFASGYAGYGWAIQYNKLYGGYAATFDEVTVRRKMRIYELEVQKQSSINGSLLLSSSCSGDLVEEIL